MVVKTNKNSDIAMQILTKIMLEPIPEVGQLTHPLKKSRQAKQITLSDINQAETEQKKFPKDKSVWTVRTLADYWAKCWQDETGLNYRITYKADCPIYSEIMKIMESNGLEKIQGTVNLIDWTMINRDQLQQKVGYITPNVLLRVINEFIQDDNQKKINKTKIMQKGPDHSLLNEIKQAETEGKATEIFLKFGIPVAVTYFVEIKKFPLSSVEKAIRERLESLDKGGLAGKEQAMAIIKSSIDNAPYPAPFSMINWRYTLSDLVDKYKQESWWSDKDSTGSPQYKYIAFLTT